MRRAFNAQKAGHAGTLDPLATGILPIALGEATKTVPFLMDARKEPTASPSLARPPPPTTARARSPPPARRVRPTRQIEAPCRPSSATIEQVPPAFSAVKVDGERAYDLARGARPSS